MGNNGNIYVHQQSFFCRVSKIVNMLRSSLSDEECFHLLQLVQQQPCWNDSERQPLATAIQRSVAVRQAAGSRLRTQDLACAILQKWRRNWWLLYFWEVGMGRGRWIQKNMKKHIFLGSFFPPEKTWPWKKLDTIEDLPNKHTIEDLSCYGLPSWRIVWCYFFTWILIRISFWKCGILRIQYQTCGSYPSFLKEKDM